MTNGLEILDFIVFAIYFWLQRKQIALKSGDVWQSVWENIVAQGLKKLDAKETSVSGWNPNIILFSGKSDHQSYLLELCKTVSGRTGIVTNFKLILDKENSKPPLKKIDYTFTSSIAALPSPNTAKPASMATLMVALVSSDNRRLHSTPELKHLFQRAAGLRW